MPLRHSQEACRWERSPVSRDVDPPTAGRVIELRRVGGPPRGLLDRPRAFRHDWRPGTPEGCGAVPTFRGYLQAHETPAMCPRKQFVALNLFNTLRAGNTGTVPLHPGRSPPSRPVVAENGSQDRRLHSIRGSNSPVTRAAIPVNVARRVRRRLGPARRARRRLSPSREPRRRRFSCSDRSSPCSTAGGPALRYRRRIVTPSVASQARADWRNVT